MSTKSETEKQLFEVLHKSAKILDLKNYSLNLNLDVQKGDGFMGEFYKVSLIDNNTKKEIKLAVKKAPEGEQQRLINSIEAIYKNEIYFYSKLYPALHAFEKEHQKSEPFHSVPEYVTSVGNLGKEMVVLKDITVNGFELREKQILLDHEHTEFIFKTYGHFHAISFCMKDQKPEEFAALAKPIIQIWANSSDNNDFLLFFTKIAEQGFGALNPKEDAALIEQFQKYVKNMREVFHKIIHYSGNYSCILHGDCWSNNMMFKYQNSKLKDITLLDFQLISLSTPVHDLSYFFYAGCSKDLFDKLEDYLDIYHQSFSETARNLGSDPEKLFPRKALSQDWKEYSKLGMLLAIILVKVKLMSKEESISLIEKANDEIKNIDDAPFLNMNCDQELFKKRVRDILVHMYEIGAL